MGNETTATDAAANATGPSSSKLRKAIRGVLEEAKYSPALTMGQIRAKVKERLQAKYPAHDFEAPAFRAESKALVATLISEWEQQSQSKPAAAASSSSANGNNDKKRPAFTPDNGDEEAEHERRRRKEEKRAKKAAEKAVAASGSSSSSAASVSSASTGAGAAEDNNPVYKRLTKLAQAMGLAPHIYTGLKEIASMEKRTDELRSRLKVKGAVFDLIPSIDDIKKAEAAWQLKKDLEGIDESLIITGSRRRGTTNAAAAAPAPAAPASAEKGKKAAGTQSSSEDEMDL